MEADGVPHGYDRWRRIGVVRHPVARLWSVYRFLSTMKGNQDGLGKWEPSYVERQRKSGALPFDRWIVENDIVFTSPYDHSGTRFWPQFCVLHALPENRKSQFIYLRPDLGTQIYRFDRLGMLAKELDVELPHEHRLPGQAVPPLSDEALDHLERFFSWDFDAVDAA
jgi:hypothetical protein